MSRQKKDPFLSNIMNRAEINKELEKIKEYDRYTYNHMVSVASESLELGKILNYNTKQLEELVVAALLHDIGKLDIPIEILNKPGRLTEEEFNIMKKHAKYSALRVKELGFNEQIQKAVLYHHENSDGSGYLEELKDIDIPEMAMIIRICDSYDAITDKRIYKNRQSHMVAFQELCHGCGQYYSPHILEKFFKLKDKKKISNTKDFSQKII